MKSHSFLILTATILSVTSLLYPQSLVDSRMNSEGEVNPAVTDSNLALDLVEMVAHTFREKGEKAAFASFADEKLLQGYYLFALDMSGKVLAYSHNDNLIGRSLINTIDARGRYVIVEFIKLLQNEENGWFTYYLYSSNDSRIPVPCYLQKIESDLFIGCEAYARH
ncbi:MAG: cache domain-containing protein [Candidatus Cloacimonetes bacterium]|nr:cache domain-containing protein [Candidatus Cloacimonadota bacterium]